MTSRISSMNDSSEWKRAYLDAILEKNRSAVNRLIDVAEEKMTSRQRELMTNGLVPCDEIEAIRDAYYLLEALRNSLPYRDDVNQAAPRRKR